MTFYYDPTISYHHTAPLAVAGLFPAFYLAPQRRGDARCLYEPAVEGLGLGAPADQLALPGPRMTGLATVLAREFGDLELADKLMQAVDRMYEPTWDRERGEFTWGFGLGEPHPRGQYNALMAAAEAMTERAWTKLFNDAHPQRFREPTVAGVDFPSVALRQAWWDAERQRLTLATSPQSEAVEGRATSFRIENLDPGVDWDVDIDGAATSTRRLAGGAVGIDTTVGRHRIEIIARRP